MKPVESIERKLADALGLRPRRGAHASLARELERVRVEHGMDADEVDARLSREPWLVGRLAGAITVEETHFLRHREHFDRLVEHVRARLASSAREVVVWSAGCASGEEPYSMAIAIHRALGAIALARVRILANDVDETAIRKACEGAYGAWSFRGTDDAFERAYFARRGSDERVVVAAIRRAVRFEHLSLEQQLAMLGPRSVDVVFFRNVGIYMTEPALESVFAGFARTLRDDGLLVLGPSDPVPRTSDAVRSLVARGILRERFASTPVPRMAAEVPVPVAPVPVSAPVPVVAPVSIVAPAPVVVPAQPPRKSAHSPTTGVFTRDAASLALSLADRGCFDDAIATLDREVAIAGPSASLLGLRGRIRLAASSLEAGVADLREAVALDGNDVLLRFHLALGLEASHRPAAARAELLEALRSLEGACEHRVLGDGETTVGSLRRAIGERLRRIE